MTRLNCIIVDDEPLALGLLENYVTRTPFLALAGKYSNAVNALDGLDRQMPPDIAFIDIQMPDLDGLELARHIDRRTKVVFTTAFDQYAIDGYKVNAIDYLLKPISYSDFLTAADKAREMCEAEGRDRHDQTSSIFVKSDYKLVQVAFSSILYIEGLKDYVKIYLTDAPRPLTSLMSLKALEEMLPASQFVRVHRSFIVNMAHARTIEHGRITCDRGSVPIGDSYRRQLQDYIDGKTV